MVQTPSKTLNLEEFFKLKETKPASEYIDAQILQKPKAQGKHSAIEGELVTAINAVLKPKRIARAFPELRCTFGGVSIVPDFSVFLNERIPRSETGEIDNIFPLSTDWVIEILSPDQSQTKVTKKILHCLKYDTQMGWLIDPEDRSIFVFKPKQQPEVFEEPADLLPAPCFADELQLTTADLFGWLLE